MANANVNLPYGVTKQLKVVGKNAANTQERAITNITWTVTNGAISVTPTGDPTIYNVVNTNAGLNAGGQIQWSAKNELNQTIASITPVTLIAADPATSIETTEQ